MARISKGRTVREFVLGAMVVQALICFVWFAWAGGTAMQLNTTGVNAADLASVDDANKLLAMIQHLFNGPTAMLLSVTVIMMMATYFITTVGSALIVFDSLSSNERVKNKYVRRNAAFWGLSLAAMSFAINYFGASAAIQAAMCLSTFPTSVLIVLLCGSLLKAVVSEKLKNHIVSPQRSMFWR